MLYDHAGERIGGGQRQGNVPSRLPIGRFAANMSQRSRAKRRETQRRDMRDAQCRKFMVVRSFRGSERQQVTLQFFRHSPHPSKRRIAVRAHAARTTRERDCNAGTSDAMVRGALSLRSVFKTTSVLFLALSFFMIIRTCTFTVASAIPSS